MKDYKAENAALRAELRVLRIELSSLERRLADKEEHDRAVVDKLRDSLKYLLGIDT